MFHKTINAFKTAVSSGKFASEGNYVFIQGIHVLNKIEKDNIYNVNALITAHNYVVIGIITLAQLAHDWKYTNKEDACPKEGLNIIHAIKNQCNADLLISRYKNHYADENWHDCVMMIGKHVMVDKTIPMYSATARFAKGGLDIQALLIPQEHIAHIPVPTLVMPEEKTTKTALPADRVSSLMNTVYSLFGNTLPNNRNNCHFDEERSQIKGPAIVMPVYK